MELKMLSCRAARHISAQIQQHAPVVQRLLSKPARHSVML